MSRSHHESVKKLSFRERNPRFNDRVEIIWRNRLEKPNLQIACSSMCEIFGKGMNGSNLEHVEAVRLMRLSYANIHHFYKRPDFLFAVIEKLKCFTEQQGGLFGYYLNRMLKQV